jgi:hypothetical protein
MGIDCFGSVSPIPVHSADPDLPCRQSKGQPFGHPLAGTTLEGLRPAAGPPHQLGRVLERLGRDL